ncbi:MAG: hypothetical protein V7750_12035 [Sneathiella sp.]
MKHSSLHSGGQKSIWSIIVCLVLLFNISVGVATSDHHANSDNTEISHINKSNVNSHTQDADLPGHVDECGMSSCTFTVMNLDEKVAKTGGIPLRFKIINSDLASLWFAPPARPPRA